MSGLDDEILKRCQRLRCVLAEHEAGCRRGDMPLATLCKLFVELETSADALDELLVSSPLKGR